MGQVRQALVAVAALWPATVAAAGVQLEYLRGDGAEVCADASELRAAVAAELHQDPFVAPTRWKLTATLRRASSRLRAHIALTDEDGRSLGTRDLSGRDCDELVPALAWVIALAVGPLTRAPAAPSSDEMVLPPEVLSRATTPPPALDVARRAPPSRTPLEARLSVGFVAALGAAPSAAPGFTLQVSLARPRWSVGFEMRGDLPASAAAAYGGTVQSSLIFGALVPCLRHRVAALCAIAALGVERGGGAGYADPRTVSGVWAALGGRIAVELPVASSVAVRVHADMLAALTRLELYVGVHDPGRRIYRTPDVSGALGLALLVSFR
jgi:hypothetical protein